MGIESMSRPAYRALQPPRGLPAGFGFRLIPKRLIRPLPQVHVITASNFNSSIPSGLPLYTDIAGRLSSILIQSYFLTTHFRASDSGILRGRRKKRSIAGNPPQDRNLQLLHRSQKRLDRVLRIDNQHMDWLPPFAFKELFHLCHIICDRTRVNRNPSDLQWQWQASFANPRGEKRQSVPFAPSSGTMHLSDSDRFRLWPRIVTGIENPHLPFNSRPVGWLTLPGIKPFQTRTAKIPQPVIVTDIVSQSFARPHQCRKEIAEIVVPGRTQCGLTDMGHGPTVRKSIRFTRKSPSTLNLFATEWRNWCLLSSETVLF